jgi:hypothetical protein
MNGNQDVLRHQYLIKRFVNHGELDKEKQAVFARTQDLQLSLGC